MKIQRVIIVLLMLAVAPVAWSQGAFRTGSDERAGEWDLSLQLLFQGSESISGSNGSGVKLDSDLGFGFMFAYNFTNHLALGFEMNFVTPDYDYTIVPEDTNTPQTVSHKADMFTGLFKGTYNILEGPLTPYIDLSLGWTYTDSNVADSPPVTGCWWDPWWGYVCQNFWSTYSDTSFSYGGGLGVRWDVSRDMFLKASYSLMTIDAPGDPTLDTTRLEVGWRF